MVLQAFYDMKQEKLRQHSGVVRQITLNFAPIVLGYEDEANCLVWSKTSSY
jgi:hypothetical protein